MDYHVVAVTLRDGQVIPDVAIIGGSFIGEIRGRADLLFDPAEIKNIEVTHRKWDFQHEHQS